VKRFREGLREISDRVGHGSLKGSVEVDQVYAHYQHEGLTFHHPDGGEPLYLLTPLFAKGTQDYMHRLAERAFRDIHGAMVDNMEDLSGEVFLRAPWEFGDLRASGHPVVSVNGAVIYDRRPNVERLGPDDLRVKSHLRDLFDPDRYGRR